jgi:hypothetical protein
MISKKRRRRKRREEGGERGEPKDVSKRLHTHTDPANVTTVHHQKFYSTETLISRFSITYM